MKVVEQIAQSIGAISGPLESALTSYHAAKGYLAANGANSLGDLLNQRLTQLYNYAKQAEEASTSPGNIAGGIEGLNKAISVLETVKVFISATDGSHNPTAMLDIKAKMLDWASKAPIPGVSDLIGAYGDAVEAIRDALKVILDALAQQNVDALGDGRTPVNGSATYGVDWAESVLARFGLDWKVLFPGAYNGN